MKRTFDTLEERLDYIEFRETLSLCKESCGSSTF